MSTQRILVDFEDAFTSYTGIPLATTGDVLALLQAGFEVGLWYSKSEKTFLIEEWRNSEPRFPTNARLNLEITRPGNLQTWIRQFLGVKFSIPKYDFFYCSLFPGVKLEHEPKRIIRMHDPYGRSQNPILALSDSGAKYKLRLANFLRLVALKKVASKSIFVFNSKYTQSRVEDIYLSLGQSEVIFPSVQFPPNKNSPIKESNLPPYWLMIGGERQRKKPATIVNLWSRCDQLKLTNFEVIGSVPIELLNPEAVTALQEGRLTFRKNLSSREMQNAIVNSIGTIFYSFGEGWGLPIAESLSCGKLTICNDLSIFREVAGSLAQYFPTSNPEMVLDIMSRGLLGDFSHTELIDNRKKFAERYQITELSKSWRELLFRAGQELR